jgi:hypothetical protein
LPSRLFPPEATASWEKHHGRLERRRIARVAVPPEEIGLCGCWQVIAVKREVDDVCKPEAKTSVEIGYYVSSLSLEERSAQALGGMIRGHWSAIENGTHYRRDVTLGEDACRTTKAGGASIMATLRNLTNGLYELEREGERTDIDTLNSWCQRQTFSTAWSLLNK